MRPAAVSIAALAFALVACGETLPEAGHVVVHLDSDVALPRTGVSQGRQDAVPIFDTARIEILRADGSLACDDCRRDVALETAAIEAGTSFTILAPGAEIVHATAFRSDTFDLSGGHVSVEIWADVPAPPADGARDVTLTFRFEDIGRPRGSIDSPAKLEEGPPPRPRHMAPFAERVPCTGTAPSDTACVPGGMFWLGATVDMPSPTLLAPRVVVVQPFFVDLHEVSVSEYRANGGSRQGLSPNSGGRDGEFWDDYCTFTEAPGRFDDYPVNCLPWSAARAYCVSQGGDLLTEAQKEYLDSALRGYPFPWGYDRPTCADAVLARAPSTPAKRSTAINRDCLPDPSEPPDIGVMGFPKAVSREDIGKDFVDLEGGRVQDLAGNLSEWLLDDWQWRDEDCWSSPTPLVDPVCHSPDALYHPVRGGSYAIGAAGVAASWRLQYPDDADVAGSAIGIRCAYPAAQ
ncbi:serine/threonine kinase [Labilithrix luteola]|uniref:Serine/threonine kinase n=1 Tax=Labilithrix luteola TaxID=1391654 RepID=A0A0K1PW16_9BACT|nr:SUMF1/EgtB/PvdO family nonheme iron enzyme [Labilithrix luteola]AKU97710.1 serine/threonine kinase [Labilithrix luteola]